MVGAIVFLGGLLELLNRLFWVDIVGVGCTPLRLLAILPFPRTGAYPAPTIHAPHNSIPLLPQIMKPLLLALALLLLPTPAQAAVPTCPTEFEPLIANLLKDLPSYANRVALRSQPLPQTRDLPKVIAAGRPEFTPLPEDKTTDPTLKQVFFTTLERQYIGKTPRDRQHFHRLLITDTRYGWRMIALYSRFGSSDGPQPPRETSQGDLGQGITQWLRDCPNPSPQGKTPVR